MSVGDVQGYKRRLKILQNLGHAPKPKQRTPQQAIDAERARAGKEAKRKVKKK
jgi:hypothetical protein